MPRRHYKKNRGYKRKKKYAVKFSRDASRITRGPLRNQHIAKLVYHDTINMDPEAGGLTSVTTFRANDMFDPYQPTGGHQPRGFDQMMAMYKEFVVIGSKITVQMVPTGTGATNNGIVYGVSLRDPSDTIETNYREYIEQGNTNYKVSDINQRNPPVSMTFSLKKFSGISKPLSVGAYAGTASTIPPGTPSKVAHYDVWLGAADQTTDLFAHTALVQIEYIAVFRDPIDFNGS